MSDVIQTLIDSLKAQCNFHKYGDCFTRACLARGYKAGGPKYSIASCLPREQAAAIEQQRAALAAAEEVLVQIVQSCVHPDTALRALLVDLKPIRDVLARIAKLEQKGTK